MPWQPVTNIFKRTSFVKGQLKVKVQKKRIRVAFKTDPRNQPPPEAVPDVIRLNSQ
jgi:hypothetical protein